MFLFHSHWEKGQSTSGIVGLSLPQSTWWKKQIAAEFFKDFSLGAIFILRKDIGVGGWSIKWYFSFTLCSENVST